MPAKKGDPGARKIFTVSLLSCMKPSQRSEYGAEEAVNEGRRAWRGEEINVLRNLLESVTFCLLLLLYKKVSQGVKGKNKLRKN